MGRAIVGIVAGLLMTSVAIPAEAAEWCIHDPELRLSAPNIKHLTVYVTDGVLGSIHEDALRKAHLDHKDRPGKAVNTLELTVRDNIPTDHLGTFQTLLILSSGPFGTGTVYGSTTGTSGRPLDLSVVIAYTPTGP